MEGNVLWLCSLESGQIKPITVDVNGDISGTTETINNKPFNGTLSGAILGFGRTSNGELVPIKVTELGAI